MASVDISRMTKGVTLPNEISDQIWQDAQSDSIVQTLSPGMTIPGGGVDIPVITGDPEADWAAETEDKAVSTGTFERKNLKGYTLAVIVPFSNQFLRDLPTLYDAVAGRLPGVLARKFDRTVLGYDESPGTGFDTLKQSPSVTLDGTVKPYLSALSTVAASNTADITGWALGAGAEIDALGAVDNAGNPLLVTTLREEGTVGQILARPAIRSNNVVDTKTTTVGVAGDWNSILWGVVQDIEISMSDQASLTDGQGKTIHLWQKNMFALRVETEIGCAVRDPKRFVKFTTAQVGESPDSEGIGG